LGLGSVKPQKCASLLIRVACARGPPARVVGVSYEASEAKSSTDAGSAAGRSRGAAAWPTGRADGDSHVRIAAGNGSCSARASAGLVISCSRESARFCQGD
jgi:hypothetical protein